MASQKGARRAALKAALPYTAPVLASFWFLGITYGAYMNSMGFSWLYPALMALLIYGGSLEFVAAQMLVSPFAPVTAMLVTLAVQARHLFYGVAMLDKYRGTGWMKPYLVFGMCDETFSILCAAEPPAGVDRRWFMFFVTAFNHSFWVSEAAIGGLAGSLASFDAQGLSFAMTALFVVILLEQWKKEGGGRRWAAPVGFASSIACLALFGPDGFMLPSLAVMLSVLSLLRRPLEEKGARLEKEARR